jgi:aminoglycoside phosphotransferase (APT) family kinase protein
VLERWIPGALLARLHVTGLREGRIATRARRAGAEAALARLTEAGILETAAAAALIAELRRCDPGTAPRTIVHRDYCPENLVLDPQGDLHVVDNEWLAIDAPAADLARTYVRWPLAADGWRRVLCGYAAVAGDPGPLRFWILAAAALGTVVRLHRSAEDRGVPLARLRELIDAAAADGAPR